MPESKINDLLDYEEFTFPYNPDEYGPDNFHDLLEHSVNGARAALEAQGRRPIAMTDWRVDTSDEVRPTVTVEIAIAE